MRISDDLYDFLKNLAIYVIPSLETFWLTIGKAWSLPYVVEIGITIGAVGLCIAGCIGMSVSAYEAEKRDKHDGVPTDGRD